MAMENIKSFDYRLAPSDADDAANPRHIWWVMVRKISCKA